ncbi:MAG: LysM peptidoglycan-binding domain-containing protein [bacterium]|nr:LysM peptidoglycan-binding domain-containing protein [bacterium]
MDLKNFLKTVKLNENTISMVLGALVLLSLTLFAVNFVRNRTAEVEYKRAQITEEAAKTVALTKTHKVEKGETLWSISEKYYKSGYNFVDIQKENKIANAGSIEVGQELTIPSVEAKKVTVVEITTTVVEQKPDSPGLQFGSAPKNPISGDTYTVVKGDHLWGIAIRAYGDGYKWVEIAKNNKFSHPDLLFVGQEVKLQR